MRTYFLLILSTVFIVLCLFITPKIARAETCTTVDLGSCEEAPAGPAIPLGNCSYSQASYDCPNGPDDFITCVQNSPLNCPGTNICSDGTYTCVNFCQTLKDANTVTTDDFSATHPENKRYDNCYTGSRCIDAGSGGVSCTEGSPNCTCDARPDCTTYYNNCLTGPSGCFPAGGGREPASNPQYNCLTGLTCRADHNCIWQSSTPQPPSSDTPPSCSFTVQNTTGVTINSGQSANLSWNVTGTNLNCQALDRRCFGSNAYL